MLSAESVCYSLDGKAILDGISLTLSQDDFVSIVGPNGAGKTSLIRCLLGLLPFQGSITLHDKDIRVCSRKEIARCIAYVPQVVGLLPQVTVEEFVSVGRYAHSSSFFGLSKNDRAIVEHSLTMTDCTEFKGRVISSLSGGERQRILLAAALAQEPKLLILDEPTSHLDPKHETELYRTLKTLHTEEGIGICMINHDINSASNVSTRVLALNDGRIAFDGSTDEFMTEEVLQRLYQTSFYILEDTDSRQKSAIVRF